jgi:lipopolysaccharide export system protein LptA
MRGTRWLLLVAIAAILGGVGYRYRVQKEILRREKPPAPAPLPGEINAKSEHWQVVEKDHTTGRLRYIIDAEEFQQTASDSRVDLKKIAMKLYAKDGDTYNLVKSAAATFNPNERTLYSDGDTEITIGVPVTGEPAKQLTVIRTSGVSFDSTTGRAETDRPSTFVFDRGDGKSTGAVYDPESHQLEMKHDVEVHWHPPKPGVKPALIESASLSYHETTSEIWLKPWGRVTRDKTVVEGTDAVIKLEQQVIRRMTAIQAHGTQEAPNRKVAYAADELEVDFNDDGVAEKVIANKHAALESTSASSETKVTGDNVVLALTPEGSDAVLTQIDASGKAVVTQKPIATPGRQIGETHVLRSDVLEMKMRPGGHEIESLVTKGPGQLEFLPNLPVQRHRMLDGNDFAIAYGPQNHLDSFRATGIKTATDPNVEEKKRNRKVSITKSRTIEAHFDPKSNQMSSMEQAGEFTYEEGDRKAHSDRATLDGGQNVILLDRNAHMNDATGATSADRIRLDERTGDFVAEGKVVSTRMPDPSQTKNSEMLSGDEPLQATAAKMDSRNRNRSIRYEGGVHMWQGANRIAAETVDIDREKRALIADGNVVTNLWDSNKDDKDKKESKGPKKPPASPVLTETRAAHMVYTEQDRLTYYSGGVVLNRPDMQVKGKELRAFMAEKGAENSIEKAFADGNVEIFSRSKDRTRTGTGDHAEYYPSDQKIILVGSWAKMVEQKFGAPRASTSVGAQLTYWANDDRLLVTGAPEKPADSHIIRKKHK